MLRFIASMRVLPWVTLGREKKYLCFFFPMCLYVHGLMPWSHFSELCREPLSPTQGGWAWVMPSVASQVGVWMGPNLPSSFEGKQQRGLLWISIWPEPLDLISAEQGPQRRVNSKSLL